MAESTECQTLGSFPDRIKNLYFSYLFLLRAVNKVHLHSSPMSAGPASYLHARLPPCFQILIT